MKIIPRKIERAIVTGPTGAVGVALCVALAAQGIQVLAVCRPGTPRACALQNIQNISIIYCDVKAYEALPAQIPGGADAFFHLAWTNTTGAGRNDMPAQLENIRATIAAVHAAAALGCTVFVGAGSQAEYGRVEGVLHADIPTNPETGYGMAKLCAGQMSRAECKKLGMAHIWARILSVYGPHDGPNSMVSATIHKLLDGETPALTAGEQQWDYLYADDAARALCLMASAGRDGAVYPLGSGQAQQLRRYVEAIRDAIDPALPLGFGELPYAENQVMHLCADLAPLTADTGFAPQVDFAAGIKKTIQWVRNVNI